MFIRSVKVPSSNGTVHEYIRIVGSVRENGKVKQKVIANLGRRDTLQGVLPMLNRFLQGDDDEDLAAQLAREGAIEALDASTWGPSLVVRHFFEQLGLWQVLDAGRRWARLLPEEDPDDDWVSRVLVLITNRLTRPSSEHMASWLIESTSSNSTARSASNLSVHLLRPSGGGPQLQATSLASALPSSLG